MKKIFYLTILVAFFTIGNISVSYAHCGQCGPSSEAGMEKKKCNCKCKCPKKRHSHKKICTKCDKSEKDWRKKRRPMMDHSEKGSKTFMSRGPVSDGYND